MSKFNKTLLAAAVAGLMVAPATQAADYGVTYAYYAKNASGSVKFSGARCKNENFNKLDASLSIYDDIDGYIYDGDFEEGFGYNSGTWFFDMFAFGDTINGFGPLIASKPNKQYTMDLTAGGNYALDDVMTDYVFGYLDNDGCKDVYDYNDDTLITKFETKLSKNNKMAKLKLDAEGSYYNDDKDKDYKVKIKVSANMDNLD